MCSVVRVAAILLIVLIVDTGLIAQKNLHQSQQGFNFEVVLGDSTGDECSVNQILVYSKNSKSLLQRIEVPDNTFYCPTRFEQIVIFEDMNFDDVVDFRVMQFLPAAPNVPYYYWIYNKKSKLFERDTTLEEITSPDFDSVKKQIVSFWRGSCCHHGQSTYSYLNGKITLIEETESVVDLDTSKRTTTSRKLINGKMIVVDKLVEDVPPDDQ